MADSFSIMIAVAGEHTGLEKMLQSLVACHKPASYQATVVIENGIKHNAEQIVARFHALLHARYLYFPRGNKSAALNYGLSTISDPKTLVFFTDDDGKVEPDTLLAYDDASQDKNQGFFFGGGMKVKYEETPPEWLKNLLPSSARGWEPGTNDDYHYTPRFLGINWAAFVGDIKQVGGFNENLGPGTKPKRTGQEWDMQEKLLRFSYKAVYVPKAQVWHNVPKTHSSFAWFLRRRFQGGFGRGISYIEEHGTRKFPEELVKYFLKHSLLLFVILFSFSKEKIAGKFADFVAGVGRIKGYFYAYFDSKH